MTANSVCTAGEPSLSLDMLKRIDDVCARFEAVWAAGGVPTIESCLSLVPESARGPLFGELLRTELELRARRGEGPNCSSLRGRFPQYAEIIDVVTEGRSGDSEEPPQLTISYRGGKRPHAEGRPLPVTRVRGEAAPEAAGGTPMPEGIKGYEIIKELGRGGMGVVYLARHLKLQRLVALKVILAGQFSTPDQRERFRAEALAVARFKHPNLVQIYAGGKYNDRPFLALEYAEGGSLEERLGGRPQLPRAAAGFLETVARAVHAVHQKGIVHRDLKPANILLDEADSASRPLERCTPKVSDFGLSRTGDANPTRSGDIVGTPTYMAPEQALGRGVGPAADVYALGVILYEMLTGRPPFVGTSTLDTLAQVCEQEPVPPRRLQVNCPRDLETICLKCLEKDASRRYASAVDLADDCAAFLAHRPLKARPIGAPGKARRWVRRNPAVAGLLAAVVLSLVAGTAAASGFAVRARHWAVAAESRAGDARHERDRAEQLAGAEAQARLRAEWLAYANQVCLAQREFERKMVPKANMILDTCRPDFRHWEHAYLKGTGGARPRVVDVRTGAVTALALDPNGRWVATAGGDAVGLWDVQTGESVKSFARLTGPIVALTFSADGRRLSAVAQTGTVVVWEVADGREVHAFQTNTGPIRSAAFNADGSRVAVVGHGAGLTVWDTVGGRVCSLGEQRPDVTRVAFSGDSRHLAAASGGGGIAVWDVTTGQQSNSLRGTNGGVLDLVFSPDGGRLAVASGEQLAVWDLGSNEQLFACREHSAPLSRVVYSPDGKRMFTGSADQTIKVWEASRGQCLLTLEGHAAPVCALALSRDGCRLVTADRAGRAHVWPAPGRIAPGTR